jgi:hypothetical protein
VLLDLSLGSSESMSPSRDYLTDTDIRFEFRVMMRWCRLFRKTAVDWVNLEAKRFRERYPLPSREPDREGPGPLSEAQPLR